MAMQRYLRSSMTMPLHLPLFLQKDLLLDMSHRCLLGTFRPRCLDCSACVVIVPKGQNCLSYWPSSCICVLPKYKSSQTQNLDHRIITLVLVPWHRHCLPEATREVPKPEEIILIFTTNSFLPKEYCNVVFSVPLYTQQSRNSCLCSLMMYLTYDWKFGNLKW